MTNSEYKGGGSLGRVALGLGTKPLEHHGFQATGSAGRFPRRSPNCCFRDRTCPRTAPHAAGLGRLYEILPITNEAPARTKETRTYPPSITPHTAQPFIKTASERGAPAQFAEHARGQGDRAVQGGFSAPIRSSRPRGADPWMHKHAPAKLPRPESTGIQSSSQPERPHRPGNTRRMRRASSRVCADAPAPPPQRTAPRTHCAKHARGQGDRALQGVFSAPIRSSRPRSADPCPNSPPAVHRRPVPGLHRRDPGRRKRRTPTAEAVRRSPPSPTSEGRHRDRRATVGEDQHRQSLRRPSPPGSGGPAVSCAKSSARAAA